MIINRVYILLTLLLAACSASTPVEVGSTALLTTVPVAGAAGVDVNAQIEVRFDSPIAPGAGHPIALQVGDCPGPVVAGTWSRTADGMGLRFTPTQPLDPSTRYTIHVGGGVTDADGGIINLDLNGPALGGTWVTLEMVMGMLSMGMGPVTQRAGVALPERDVWARLRFHHGTVAEANGASLLLSHWLSIRRQCPPRAVQQHHDKEE